MRFIKTLAAGTAALAAMLCVTASSYGAVKISSSPHNLNNIGGTVISKNMN